MKKGSALLIVCVIAIFFACGPSETERKAEEEKAKRQEDSTKTTIKEEIASQMDSLKRDNKTSDSLVKEEKTKTK
jgi:hypothetical protein